MELQRATKEGVLELDRISAKIGSTVTVPADGGNADTVNGHTVECDVPADAKFTDTIYNDSALKATVANKVDKVSGKGLSTNDYTNPEKQKLAGLSNYDDSTLRQYITSLEEQNKLLQEQVEALQARVNNKGWILLE